MTKKIAAFLTEGFELVEFTAPLDLLRRANFDVTTISLDDTKEVTSKQEVTVLADKSLAEVNLDDFDALFFPGGYLDLNKYLALEETIRSFHSAGKLLFAICAAPTVLARLGLLKGKNGVCFPAMRADLENNGCTFLDTHIVEEDNIIMGRAMGAAYELGFAVTRYFNGAKAEAELRAEVVA